MLNKGILAAAALLMVTASPANSQVVLSENFDTAVNGGFGVFTPSGAVAVADGNAYIPCCGTTGTSTNMENNFVAFGGGDRPSGSIMSADFGTVLGQLYSLSFDYGALGPAAGETLTFTIASGSESVSVSRFAATDNNLNTTFENFVYYFTGSGSLTSLSFVSGGVASADAILDNVVISAVPEPEVWAMLLFGFGAIGMQMRRRRSLQTVTA